MKKYENLPQENSIGDMSYDDLSQYGYRVIDWVTRYISGEIQYPILSRSEPGELRALLSSSFPQQAETMDEILQDIEQIVVPRLTHWNTSGFMGYFGVSSSGPSILGDLLDSALNVTRVLWRTAPAATELEQLTLDWLRQMLNLPAPLFGLLHYNSAFLHILVAAREAWYERNENGCRCNRKITQPTFRIYASQEAHVSLEKAAIVLGLGRDGVRKIPTDDQFRMQIVALEQAIEEDRRAGWTPLAVVATIGTTSTTSIDPVPLIVPICQRQQVWLHVDAAYAGVAALLPSRQWILSGCEWADSLSVNPHKWLFVSLGCSVLFTRWPQVLKRALSLTPAYLQNPDEQEGDNLIDYHFSLPHHFPALKLWMVIRYFGKEGLRARIQEHCRLAQLLASWIDASPHFERMAPTPFSVVCLRAHPPGMDQEQELTLLNQKILQAVNEHGDYFISHTLLRNIFILRVAISHITTTEKQVHGLWLLLQDLLHQELQQRQQANMQTFCHRRLSVALISR